MTTAKAVDTMLLESYLKQLRLPTFVANYRTFAEDAAQAQQSYERYLLALVEQEATQRDRNRQQRRIKGAHFPVLKELADFDFSSLPSLNAQRVLGLARGEYIQKAEALLLVGNPGLGENSCSDRACACRMSTGASGTVLQHCRSGQRPDRCSGGAPVTEAAQHRPAPSVDRAGRTGLHPADTHRGTTDLPVLLDALRTCGVDRNHQPAVCRLGAGIRGRALDRGPIGPLDPSRAHPGVHRRGLLSLSPAPAKRYLSQIAVDSMDNAPQTPRCPHCPPHDDGDGGSLFG